MKKYKLTGCAKFAIALIIIAPIAYFVASYVNNEDGVQNIKNLLGINGKDTTHIEQVATPPSTDDADLYELRQIIEDQQEQIEQLQEEVKRLREVTGLPQDTSGQ